MLGSNVPCRVGFHSKASDPRVHAQGGARDHNIVHFQNVSVFKFSYHDSFSSESIYTGTIGTLETKLLFCGRSSYPDNH